MTVDLKEKASYIANILHLEPVLERITGSSKVNNFLAKGVNIFHKGGPVSGENVGFPTLGLETLLILSTCQRLLPESA